MVQFLRILIGDRKKMGMMTAEDEEDSTDSGKLISSL